MRINIYLVGTSIGCALEIEVARYTGWSHIQLTDDKSSRRKDLCFLLTDPLLDLSSSPDRMYQDKLDEEDYTNVRLLESFTVQEKDLETRLVYWMSVVEEKYPEYFI
jgi:hypothetical protein